MVRKIYDGEMSIKRFPTALLEIVRKIVFDFQVTVENIVGADVNIKRN